MRDKNKESERERRMFREIKDDRQKYLLHLFHQHGCQHAQSDTVPHLNDHLQLHREEVPLHTFNRNKEGKGEREKQRFKEILRMYASNIQHVWQ